MPDYQALLEALRPLVKPCVEMKLIPVERLYGRKLSRLESKFGGEPYLPKGEPWPVCAACGHGLTFICQFDLFSAGYHLPDRARLFTFFYCWKCMPWGDMDETPGMWQARFYGGKLESEVLEPIVPQPDDRALNECLVEFSPAMSFPHNFSLYLYSPKASEILDEFYDLQVQDYEVYARAVLELGGINEDISHLGGYPDWDQQHESYAPLDYFGTLAMQDEANLMFGDAGHANFFISPRGSTVERLMIQSG